MWRRPVWREAEQAKLDTYFKQHEFRQIYDHGVAVMRRLGVPVSPDTFNPVVVDFYRDVATFPWR